MQATGPGNRPATMLACTPPMLKPDMPAVQPAPHLRWHVRGTAHYEFWEYCRSASKVQAQVLANLRVRQASLAGAAVEGRLRM